MAGTDPRAVHAEHALGLRRSFQPVSTGETLVSAAAWLSPASPGSTEEPSHGTTGFAVWVSAHSWPPVWKVSTQGSCPLRTELFLN